MRTTKERLFIAGRRLGLLDAQQTVDAATDLLADGVETEAIIFLAGLLRNPNPFEVDDLARKAVEELGGADIHEEDAHWVFVCHLARQILEGSVPPAEGAGAIWNHCIALDYPESLTYFGYLWSDYGEDPTAVGWFNERILSGAREILEHGRCQGM